MKYLRNHLLILKLDKRLSLYAPERVPMRNYDIRLNEKSIPVTLINKKGSVVEFKISDETYLVDIKPVLDTRRTAGPAPTAQIQTGSGEVKAPMPGIIVSIAKTVGTSVTAGENLLVIEAMKMENNIAAPKSGTIKSINIKPGQEVNSGQLLLVID
jgi:biotin carboxyl carrier protein